MASKRLTAAVLFAVVATGCVSAKSLRPPVAEHYLQTRVITDRCAAGEYGVTCPPHLVEDLELMREQARLLVHVAAGTNPDTESPKAPK